jgi:hypothetical protein
MNPLFSILILSVPNRLGNLLIPLYDKLLKQMGESKDVEILCLVDNKMMSIGEKRQKLLTIARGKWVGFLDDDDDIADSYIGDLRAAMTLTPADVITFNQHCTINGDEFRVFFDIANGHDPVCRGPDGNFKDLRRFPYHMCFWRADVAKTVPFKDCSYGEDFDWCLRMMQSGMIRTQTKINKILHYYRFEDGKSESLKARNEQR